MTSYTTSAFLHIKKKFILTAQLNKKKGRGKKISAQSEEDGRQRKVYESTAKIRVFPRGT